MKRALLFMIAFFLAVALVDVAKAAEGQDNLVGKPLNPDPLRASGYDFGRLERIFGLRKGEGKEIRSKFLAGDWKMEYVSASSGVQYATLVTGGYRTLESVVPGWQNLEPVIPIALPSGQKIHFFLENGWVGLSSERRLVSEKSVAKFKSSESGWCPSGACEVFSASPPPSSSPPVNLMSPVPHTSPVSFGVSNQGTPTKKQRDTWDWYLGAGNYHSVHGSSDNKGYYTWSRFRYRPFWFDPDANTQVGVGAFGYVSGGRGKAEKYSRYSSLEAALGGTAKVLVPHRDFNLDVGASGLWKQSRWKGELKKKQFDASLLVSAHANLHKRRDEGEKIFPKAEAHLKIRVPFETKISKGKEKKKKNNFLFEGQYTQGLVDIGSKAFTVTPGINIGGGFEASSKDSPGFAKFGPHLEISSYGNTVAGISIFNYQTNNHGKWYPIEGYISLDGISNAWKAGHISQPTCADLAKRANQRKQ